MKTGVYLIAAILFEVCGTLLLKVSDGFTRWLPTVLIFVFYGASMALLAIVVKHMPISTAYAIWSAVGTALIAVAGVLLYHEPITAGKVISLALIIAGVVGLNLSQSGH